MPLNAILLSSSYLGPVEWYAAFLSHDATIERYEHYVKQTWRNRARIAGPNGVQDLVIPVHARNHTPMHEVTINYTEAWQRQHWQSIRSAYGNSPFFDFYADHFSPFYEKRNWEKLLDYNTELLALTLRLLKQKQEIVFTNEFIASPTGAIDLRSLISPKENSSFAPKRYLQVFEERHGFIPNLSIIDLLCCTGPDSSEILRS